MRRGATEVHVRIASPPFKNPCFYGVDTSTYEELLCARMSVPEACEYIGADSLAYLSPDALLKAGNRCELCMACFTGNYPTSLYGTIEEANKKKRKMLNKPLRFRSAVSGKNLSCMRISKTSGGNIRKQLKTNYCYGGKL